MVPTWVIPASARHSRPWNGTVLSATGTSCSAEACVIGRDRVPAPPDSTRAFICVTLARIRRNRPRRGGDLGVTRRGPSVLAAEDVALPGACRGGRGPVLDRGQAGPQVSLAVQATGPGPARLGPACDGFLNGLRGHGGSPSFHAALPGPPAGAGQTGRETRQPLAAAHTFAGDRAHRNLTTRPNRPAPLRCWAGRR